MKHEVFWKNSGYRVRPALHKPIACDYLIVGGGITGVSLAYFLSTLGAKNIVLIEKNYIGSGATGKAAGTLVVRGESDLLDYIKVHGKKNAVLYWHEIRKELEEIKTIIRNEKIKCDAESQDTLYCDFKHKTYINIRKEYAEEKKIDPAARFLEGKALKKEINTNLFARGILSAKHGLSVNPLQLVQNFSKTLEKYHVKIYENTEFLGVSDGLAKTSHATIAYKHLILALDADSASPTVRTQKTTIAITEPLTVRELVKTNLQKKKIVFDSKKNYDYLKILNDRRLLFGFGIALVHKKHRATEPHVSHLKNIQNFIKKLFPYLDLRLEYAWSGSFGVTKNYEPDIEFSGTTVSISGAGTQVVCFMAAKHVANKLLHNPSPFEQFFD